MIKILCFGDSNTWGTMPLESRRYEPDERWPGVLAKLLPDNFLIIEEGQPNRTLVNNPPFSGDKSGIRYLKPCLEQYTPNLVVIMLGTNDFKKRFDLSVQDISAGAERLVNQVLNFKNHINAVKPQVLLVSPPGIFEVGAYAKMYQGGELKSVRFAKHLQQVAQQLNCAFFDAAAVIKSCQLDGVHWQAEEHKKLAFSLAPVITAIIKN